MGRSNDMMPGEMIGHSQELVGRQQLLLSYLATGHSTDRSRFKPLQMLKWKQLSSAGIGNRFADSILRPAKNDFKFHQ